MSLKPLTPKSKIKLSDADATYSGKGPTGNKDIEDATEKETDRISDLQRVFYADARHALLIVLQGRDAAGKDGTIRKVFSAVNPQGCTVHSFKAPTDTERAHDYLWRVHAAVPARGMIGIFNRSHYEDVIVPRVHGDIDHRECKRRFRQIVDFERMLSEEKVVILKFMLHISREEQKRRLEERLEEPKKRWKFQEGDLDDRKRWDAFGEAYEDLLKHTSTKWAPWYVVPADDKKIRNWLISRTIAQTLAGLGLRYPNPHPEVERLRIE